MVKAPNWLSHLEYDWKSPFWRHLARELSQERTLVRFDQRGNGLSDWRVDDISFEAFVRDLETVVDAAKLDRFALLGISQGCAISVAYAARHPERVSHLVLYGGYTAGWHHGPRQPSFAALHTLMREGWGAPHSTFRQMFSTLFMPEATPAQTALFNELQQVSASGESAARLFQALGPVNVRPLLANITAPTLVLHAASGCGRAVRRGAGAGRGHSRRSLRAPGGPQPPAAGGRAGLAPLPGRGARVPGHAVGLNGLGPSRRDWPRRGRLAGMSGLEVLIPIVALLSVFGLPTGLLALHLRQRHRERLRALETSAQAGRVEALESARAELEARVRTLETIATSGDRDLEARLRQLSSATPPEPRALTGSGR